MSEDWAWFIDAITTHILPTLEVHHFKQLTGTAYEPDPHPDPNDPIGRVLFFLDDTGIVATVDVIYSDISQFYWLRVAVGQQNLKANISDLPTQPSDVYEAQGWVFTEKSQIDSILKLVVQVLKDYLKEQSDS